MSNRLAHESSPYLLQHANNPVDWFSWSEEALQKAVHEDKPIFLSIGYSACHWCHVMEHESFEDPNISAYLNEHFVSIKVDREERPDLDHIYMQAVMAISGGRGGWPLSAFLTPDQQVFFGGTYWPPRTRQGMPGFDHVLKMVHEAFHFKRDQVIEQSRQLTDLLNQQMESEPTGLSDEVLQTAARTLERSFDFTNGGFGSAPKFPHTMDLQLLLRLWSRWPANQALATDRILEMVRLNLHKMARGGIYDHLAGGFARYSVDERWLVPHFEKMLYDNALLTEAYLDAFLVTGERQFAQTAMETLDYILNYLTDPAGGFHSTEDADSEGEEGKFYLWTVEEIRAVLGEEAGERFCEVYDVSAIGNFEGRNILNLRRTIEQTAALKNWNLDQLQTDLQSAKSQLLKVRDQRVRPGKDDKVLTSWNALMISAMARAAHILGEERYLTAASRAADFLLQNLRKENGRLLRSWRHGTAKLDAYLDDYTYFINALLTLYESSFETRWLETAVELAEIVISRFADQRLGGFYFTADDHEQLIARIKEFQDSSIPSGNSMAALAFARLGHLTGNAQYLEIARRTVESCAALLSRSPTAFGQMLLVWDMLQRPIKQIVIAADDVQQGNRLLQPMRNRFLPDAVLAFAPPADRPRPACLRGLLEGKQMVDGQATLYICEGFTCLQPVHGEAEIAAALKQLGYQA